MEEKDGLHHPHSTMSNTPRRPLSGRLAVLTLAATTTAVIAASVGTGAATAAPGGQPGLNSTTARSTQDTASKLAGLTTAAPAPAPQVATTPVVSNPTPAPAPAPVYQAPTPTYQQPVYQPPARTTTTVATPAPVVEQPVVDEAPVVDAPVADTAPAPAPAPEADIVVEDTIDPTIDSTLTQDESIIETGGVNLDRFPELHALPEGRTTPVGEIPVGDDTIVVEAPIVQATQNPTVNEETGNANGYQLSGSVGEGFSAATAEQLSQETGYTTASTVQVGSNRVGVATSYETNKDYNRAMAVNGDQVGQGMYAISSDDHGNNTATAAAAVDWSSTDGVVSLTGSGTGTLANFGLESPNGDLTLTVGDHSTTWSI